MKNAAAIYLRSSKDRSDVSIDAQARELLSLAEQKSLLIVRRFEDVVESAKDENRPGFQALLTDLKASSREWDHLLMVDTSRLSRRRYMAEVFAHEARKRGVDVLVGKARFRDNARGQIIGDSEGLTKLVFEAPSGRLMGAHIIGERATELIHVGAVVLAKQGTIHDFIDLVFNFPTLSETYKYAAYDGLGQLNKYNAEKKAKA